jgi:putative flippase GtrA
VSKSVLNSQLLRFLIVGGTNTLITYAIFVALGLIIDPGIAFTIAFVIGLVWVTAGSSRFVFRGATSARRIAIFLGWYLFIYAIGRLIVHLLDPQGVTALLLTSLAVLVVTTPLTFIGGRLIFTPMDTVPEKTSEEEETS